MKKVVLAFSGGLDTSFCCIYLTQDLGLEVHSVVVNTGGFLDEELKNIEENSIAFLICYYTLCAINTKSGSETIALNRFRQVLKTGGMEIPTYTIMARKAI